MIITVTSSTVTSITTIAAMGLTAALSIAVVVSLIAFLATKHLASATHPGSSPYISRISKFANVAILPMVMAFVVILAVKIIEIIV